MLVLHRVVEERFQCLLQVGGALHAKRQRLNLAAAMSATVEVKANGDVKVISVGGSPTVVRG